MNKNNKITKGDNTDKKLHISDVMISFPMLLIILTLGCLMLIIDSLIKPLSLVLVIIALLGIYSINKIE